MLVSEVILDLIKVNVFRYQNWVSRWTCELGGFLTGRRLALTSNAEALGQALHERGFGVIGEHKGFTESHRILVDVSKYGLGGDMERALESANIILNRQLIPGDTQAGIHY